MFICAIQASETGASKAMYHKRLHIDLFGLPGDITDVLSTVEPLERFEDLVEAHATLDEDAFRACDVAIVSGTLWQAALDQEGDGAASELVSRRRRDIASRNGSFDSLVVLTDPEQTRTWSAEDYALVDDIWPADPTLQTLIFEFSHLQLDAKRAADARLCETYLDATIDSVPSLIWFKDARGAHLKVNDAFCDVVGKTKEQVAGRGHYYIWDITPTEYAAGEYVCMESETETMEAGHTCLFDEEVRTRDGMRQLETYKSPLFDEDGSVMGTVGVAHDVTDFDNVATKMAILLDALPSSVIIENLKGEIIQVNSSMEDFFSTSKEEVVGLDIEQWEASTFKNAKRKSISSGKSSVRREEVSATIAGRKRIFDIEKTVVVDVFGSETGRLRIYRDVTKERRLQHRVEQAATTDYLTGLFNRRYCRQYLEQHRKGKPLTLVLFDLDNFKDINDDFGHMVGDEVLLAFSRELNRTFPDAVSMRWGGDEFVVSVLGPCDVHSLRDKVNGMLEGLKDKQVSKRDGCILSASAGIASTSDGTVSIDELFSWADDALYQAKRVGKVRCFISRRVDED
jgi:diguanylate cyclase (GGDEF)-like protein/PAS domain S-box-containing protein